MALTVTIASVPLADELLKSPYNLNLVGTLKSNKREIPEKLKNSRARAVGTSMFCYAGEKTLMSHKPKSNNSLKLFLHNNSYIHLS